MLNYLRRLLSPEIRQARRLLRHNTGTSIEALLSAERIRAMVSYDRHSELRMLRAGCLIEGMGHPHADALGCAEVAGSVLQEFGILEYGVAALRHAANDCQDESLQRALLAKIEVLPGILQARVIGELYKIENGATVFRNSREIQEYHISAMALRGALEPAYQQYSAYLTSLGYQVEGRFAVGPNRKFRFQLSMMSFHA